MSLKIDKAVLPDDLFTSGGYIEISSQSLSELCQKGELIPGQWYRIIDYTYTPHNSVYMESGKHTFDILIQALTQSTLNESAFAAHHEGDTYFAACNLSAWELKYSPSTGTIYYMKDEFGNEAPYDFKNAIFRRVTTYKSGVNTVAQFADVCQSSVALNLEQRHAPSVTVGSLTIFAGGTAGYRSYTFQKSESLTPFDISISGDCRGNVIQYLIPDKPIIVQASTSYSVLGNTFDYNTYGVVVTSQSGMIGCKFTDCQYITLYCSSAVINNCQFNSSQGLVIRAAGDFSNNSFEDVRSCLIYTQSHLKNNKFAGRTDQIKIALTSMQNTHVNGYVKNINLYGEGYLIASKFEPYTADITMQIPKWVDRFYFNGARNVNLTTSTYACNSIFYPGDYSNITSWTINEYDTSALSTSSARVYEYKPSEAVTFINGVSTADALNTPI